MVYFILFEIVSAALLYTGYYEGVHCPVTKKEKKKRNFKIL